MNLKTQSGIFVICDIPEIKMSQPFNLTDFLVRWPIPVYRVTTPNSQGRCPRVHRDITGGWDNKRPSELDVLLKITQNNDKQNGDMYNRHDAHRILSKINYQKNNDPIKIESAGSNYSWIDPAFPELWSVAILWVLHIFSFCFV